MFDYQTMQPYWPPGLERRMRPLANLRCEPAHPGNRLALQQAMRVQDRAHQNQCSGYTQTWSEMLFSNRSDFTAVASSASETSLLSGTNEQPVLPALFFDGNRGFGRTVSFVGQGVLGTTGTPTITFTVRFGTTSGPSYLSGVAVSVSAAITTSSGVSNKYWRMQLDISCNTPGIGTGNTTLSGAGYVMSPGGFASPFIYPMEPSTPDTATWTSTIDSSLTQYVNFSITWSASSASNTCTLKQLLAWGQN
jgi:hypothetical protein